MELPFGGTESSDDFRTGTIAAAHGGTTSIIDFVVQYAGENPLDQYALWHQKAAGNCAIDYGFHQILSDVQDSSLDAMDELVAEGVSSFKLFQAYKGVFLSDDGQILRAMQKAEPENFVAAYAYAAIPARVAGVGEIHGPVGGERAADFLARTPDVQHEFVRDRGHDLVAALVFGDQFIATNHQVRFDQEVQLAGGRSLAMLGLK